MIHRARSAAALLCLAALVSAAPARAQGCGTITSGNVPLVDMQPGQLYQGFEGGLYPGAALVPPAAHLAAALGAAAKIVPRDAAGNPDPGCGLIGFVSIGFSNPTHEWGAFQRQEDPNPLRHPRVVLVNCGHGGQSAEKIDTPGAFYWTLVGDKVQAAGLSPQQVQVAWMKEAHQGDWGPFPGHAQTLRDQLVDIVQILKQNFPNLRLLYLSSRIWGGYTSGGSNEPQAYEEGFAFKWLIRDQITGADPGLNWDPSAGPVLAPVLLWGPYLWADGPTPRALDGLQWCLQDFEQNGNNQHPSALGEQKVADLLSQFLASDPSAQPWYSNPGLPAVVAIDAEADAHVELAAPTQNFGADPLLQTGGASQQADAYARFDLSGLPPGPVLYAKLDYRNPEDPLSSSPRDVLPVADDTWSELGITFSNAPQPLPVTPVTIPASSRDGNRSADVTPWVNAQSDGRLTLVLRASAGDPATSLVDARESGTAPRLVVTVAPGGATIYCTAKPTSLGCLPAITATGIPGTSDPVPFLVSASQVPNQRNGLFFYGLMGRASLPFLGGTLCALPPLRRTPVQTSGGNPPPPDCSGTYAFDLDAWIATGNAPALTPGQQANGQYWFRDPPDPFGAGLSDAVEFWICP